MSNETTDGPAPPETGAASGEPVGYHVPELPPHLVYPVEQFADEMSRLIDAGKTVAMESHVHVTGLARNCQSALAVNLATLEQLRELCGELTVHVEENDSRDGTPQVLAEFGASRPWATARCRQLDRIQRGGEFVGPRTQELAEYREECRQATPRGATFVGVLDFDAAGSFSLPGVLHSIGYMSEHPAAYGCASVSLLRSQVGRWDGKTTTVMDEWIHYDAWALRLNSTFDDYRAGMGSWKHQWIPPVGSPPVAVASAFGGLAIYDAARYVRGRYDGRDCEHVTFHESLASEGQLFLNPSQRVVMGW